MVHNMDVILKGEFKYMRLKIFNDQAKVKTNAIISARNKSTIALMKMCWKFTLANVIHEVCAMTLQNRTQNMLQRQTLVHTASLFDPSALPK